MANELPRQKSNFKYPNLETATLVRDLIGCINKRVETALHACYENGRDLCEIRSYLGYGGFNRWLKSAEWEYSPRMAYKFLIIYERSLELGLLPEWFGKQLLIPPTTLAEILAPSKEASARKMLELLESGKKVDKEFIRQIQPVLSGSRLKSAVAVSNQGVQFSSFYKWEGLRFRSKVEIKIATVLEQYVDVAFWPNCRGRLNTPEGKRNLEPDFLVCYKGKFGILEVDGPFHTPERRVEEQERERLFRNHGIRVIERFDYKRCQTEPEKVVEEFLQIMEKMY